MNMDPFNGLKPRLDARARDAYAEARAVLARSGLSPIEQRFVLLELLEEEIGPERARFLRRRIERGGP